MFSDGGDDSPFETVFGESMFGPVIDPPAYPPTNIADSTAVPIADLQAQVETGTGAFNRDVPGHGVPGEVGPVTIGGDLGGGNFNPEILIDTSTTSTSGPSVSQP